MMRILATVIFAFFLSTLPAFADDASTQKAAEAYVDHVAKEALDTIALARSGKISEDEAKTKFRVILNNAFDIPTIAKFTLGRYWRVATPAEQKEYTSLLQSVILNKYADRLLNFSGDGYSVDNSRILNERDVAVATTIKPKNDPEVSFGWRVRKAGNSFKVIDLSVEGVSMSVTHRTDFSAVIERDGGKVKALIDALKSKQSK